MKMPKIEFKKGVGIPMSMQLAVAVALAAVGAEGGARVELPLDGNPEDVSERNDS